MMKLEQLDCDVLVIGSGPGGASTAAWLAEQGVDVLLMEEGDPLPLDSAKPYSLDEMTQKWRNGGLTPAFGRTQVTYVEGRCVGGASEVNAGLYHRPLSDVLSRWSDEYGLRDFGPRQLQPHIEQIEQEMSVSYRPGGPGQASRKVREGADALGWGTKEIARFWKYDGQDGGARQSMSATMIPRLLEAGGRLRSRTRARRINMHAGRARSVVAWTRLEDGGRCRLTVRFEQVFVCAGAVQTALLLRRSGLTHGVGDTLTMNPMIRVAARFPEVVNDPSLGVPVEQVEQFKPLMTLGCSYSAVPHLALWLADRPHDRGRLLDQWDHVAIYYAKVVGLGRGKVRNMPGWGEALVRFPVTAQDLKNLGLALHRLSRLVFAGGAVELFSPIKGADALQSESESERFLSGLSHGNVSLSAIHLHSSCPMGEPSKGGAVDSFGRLHASDNVYLNDSSILPDTPGVNPQGTIMAIAHRNVWRFLDARAG